MWFRKQVKGLVEKLPTASRSELEGAENAVMVVARVEDWDASKNDYWDLPVNKSFPREGLVCAECKKPVVMSDGLYASFIKNPKSPKAMCFRCVPAFAQLQKNRGDEVNIKKVK